MTLRALLRPSLLVLIPASLSALVWVAPLGMNVRRGFVERAHLTLSGVVVLATWYGIIAVAGEFGFALGRDRAPLAVYERISDESYYRYFSLVALAGTGFTYASVAVLHPGLLTTAFTHLQLNLVRAVIPYSAGIPTLRYATGVAGAIALFEIVVQRRVRMLNLANLVALLLAAAIASRLLVVLCVVIFVGLIVRRRPDARVSLKAVVLGACAFFLVLTPLNYYRNALYYKTQYHLTNPFVMNAYEMSAYLGAPFQAAVGVASATNPPTPPSYRAAQAAIAYGLPTYVPLNREGVTEASTNFRSYVDVDPALTTDSVLAALFSAMGWWSFVFIGIVAFVAGAAMGHAAGYRSLAGLAMIVVGYAFTETWRVYLFNAGIVQFIVLTIVIAPMVVWRRDARYSADIEPGDPALV